MSCVRPGSSQPGPGNGRTLRPFLDYKPLFQYSPVTREHTQTAESIWKDPQWILDPIVPQGPTQMQFVGGTRIGDADYIYMRNSSTSQHSVIELTLNAALFGGATIESVFLASVLRQRRVERRRESPDRPGSGHVY
jgi:hypothetical protein